MGDISYELEKEEGPDHDKSFHVNALIGPEVYGHGVGHTKSAREQTGRIFCNSKITEAIGESMYLKSIEVQGFKLCK